MNSTNPPIIPHKNSKTISIVPRMETEMEFLDGDCMALTATAPAFLIKGILEQDSHGVMFGASMSYKTFVALSMAHSVCTGRDFMGHKVRNPGTVLYVCGEGSGAMKRRVRAQVIKNGGFDGNFKMLDGSISIDNSSDMAKLRQAIKKIKPALVIFDTFSSLVSTTNENDNSSVSSALRLIKETCRTEFGTSSVIVHHTGKDDSKGMRGASAFKNNVDFGIELKRSSRSTTTMSCEKMKDGENFTDINMTAEIVDLGIVDEDGDFITSLVMSKAEGSSYNSKATKFLNKNDLDTLAAMSEAMSGASEAAPPRIVEKFGGAVEQVVSIDTLRRYAYPRYMIDQKSKRSALRRALINLESAYKIIHYDGYLWLIHTAEQAERGGAKTEHCVGGKWSGA